MPAVSRDAGEPAKQPVKSWAVADEGQAPPVGSDRLSLAKRAAVGPVRDGGRTGSCARPGRGRPGFHSGPGLWGRTAVCCRGRGRTDR